MHIKYRHTIPSKSSIIQKKIRQLSFFFSCLLQYNMAGIGSTQSTRHYQLKKKSRSENREQFDKTCKTARSTEHWPLLISIKSEFYEHTREKKR